MSIVHIMQMQQKVAKKLMAAIAMLLVAAVLMGVTTYAWISISTAPEAREIKTALGGNGFLEIALQSGTSTITGYERNNIESYSRTSNITTGQSIQAANNTWGNIIFLDNNTYGLNYVKLYPSRLNLTENYAVSSESFLVIPTFGTDGRMSSVEQTSRLFYNGSSFTQGINLGVSVHGNAASAGNAGEKQVQKYYSREDFVFMMSQQLADERQQVYDNLLYLLEETCGEDLIMLLDYVAKNNSLITDQQAFEAAGRLLEGLTDVNQQAQALLRYTLIARAAADLTTFPPDDPDKMDELSQLYSEFGTWTIDTIKTTAQNYHYNEIVTACNRVNTVNTQLNRAKTQLTPTSVSNSMSNILTVNTGTYIYQNNVMMHATNANAVTRALALRSMINDKYGDVWLGNGILYHFAGILGDFVADLEKNDYDISLHVSGSSNDGRRCDPESNKGFISGLTTTIINYINEEEDDYGQIYSTVTEYDTITAYGYSVDMAFRSNETGRLILQQQGLDRILGVTDQEALNIGRTNASTQGNGSNMNFTFASDMTKEQVTALMQSMYVVFMNQYNRIVAVASAGTVTVKNRSASADLVLYNYNTNDGILRTTSKKSDQSIIEISANTPVYITAIVYLSGDAVASGIVSATQANSLSGTVNIQFSHSKYLIPMSIMDIVEE